MSVKRVLQPVRLESAKSLAASFTTTPTVLTYLDNVAYQINVSTSDSEGTFSIEGSLDYVAPTNPMTAPGDTGNWAALPLSGIPTAAAEDDVININLNQVPFTAVRLRYTSDTAGTGTCEIYIAAKGLS